ncbi:MAG: urease accessory protein UreF [Rhodobacteraceae bacterium]|nr:MAG: urease accessory protein UreF [Paracoccaceae bacterium]
MSAHSLALIRLLQVSDTAFPSGAFAFSSGLETLFNEGRVTKPEGVQAVLAEQILPRWASFDRVFLHAAHAAAGDLSKLSEIDARCHLQSSSDRLAHASRRIGRSLLSVHARIGTPGAAAYRSHADQPDLREARSYEPVMQGLIGAGLGLNVTQCELGAVHSTCMAFVSAAVRLGRLGAIEAQGLLAATAPRILATLEQPVPQLAGAFSPFAEIAALRRNTTQAVLFAT